MRPAYDLDKIKFGVGSPTFERAVGLYEDKKVTKFKEDFGGYSAVVLGTHPYDVSVSARHYDRGNCNCYLGQRDELCKHMVAVAIYAVMGGKELSDEDKEIISSPVCSGKPGELSKEELSETKKAITSAMRYIKAYTGPSRIWFAYQNSLSEGCLRLSKLVSNCRSAGRQQNYWWICCCAWIKSYAEAALMIRMAPWAVLFTKP